PGLVAVITQEMRSGFGPDLESQIKMRVEQFGKHVKIVGLEGLYGHISPISKVATLEDLEEELTGPKSHQKDISDDAYLQGDLAAYEKYIQDEMATHRDFEKALLTDRNQAWLSKFKKLHSRAGVHFFAVGAAHLAGEQGLLKLLAQKGFIINRIEK